MGCITLVALQTSYASAISSSNITAMKEVFGTTAVTGELSTAVFLWGVGMMSMFQSARLTARNAVCGGSSFGGASLRVDRTAAW